MNKIVHEGPSATKPAHWDTSPAPNFHTSLLFKALLLASTLSRSFSNISEQNSRTMRLPTFIASVFVAATPIVATPIQSLSLAEGPPGNVFDANAKIYSLKDTGIGNIYIITDKIDGYFMRPVSFHVEQDYVCKFYSESTRGIGSLIGTYEGPLDGTFGDDWAAFYQCSQIAGKAVPKVRVIGLYPAGRFT
ncbi:uncharacterized protein K460DRAFT_198485 [Cucurbitaria berberidis CBS 394.84]|uniref:Uncharacterized protein n=1 Tax=Cucurbitaria berberidis CBS 394.84 TaxID=1168544 RepID=A0A9P4G900_9PLEO|nr:uncharacterized protein K460DRAFT_198485 [Cucurbitaria berberidis CBS 394.84]KAF1841091.1 hypothetical protein K460DRAFT_198485 [Cucurbitaria berberidis CBS 394.84]